MHEIHLKTSETGAERDLLKAQIREACDAFYDIDVLSKTSISSNKENSEKKITMSSTALDEHDKIKEMWAFNLPCMLLVNGKRKFWNEVGRDIYKTLYKDILIKIRISLAASLLEVAKLIDLKDQSEEAN